MIRAVKVLSKGDLNGSPDDSIDLDYDQRHRRRIVMTSNRGREFLLDLPKAVAIADGDALELEDGSVVAVRAKPEPLVDITASDARHLAQLAWHLGNRHLPTEISDGRLRIRDDHVIVDMLRKLGARLKSIEAPFQPESGAYGHDH